MGTLCIGRVVVHVAVAGIAGRDPASGQSPKCGAREQGRAAGDATLRRDGEEGLDRWPWWTDAARRRAAQVPIDHEGEIRFRKDGDQKACSDYKGDSRSHEDENWFVRTNFPGGRSEEDRCERASRNEIRRAGAATLIRRVAVPSVDRPA